MKSLFEQLLEEEQAKNTELRRQLSYIERELRRIVDAAYGEGFSDDCKTLDDLLGDIENLNSIIEADREYRDKLERTLKAYQEMFPCSVCGKPMRWSPDDNLGQALKAFVREKGWGHAPCVNPQKR